MRCSRSFGGSLDVVSRSRKTSITHYLLFVLELAARRVQFAGFTPGPDGPWMTQTARNLTDYQDRFLNGKRYLLLDRDTKFAESFVQFWNRLA